MDLKLPTPFKKTEFYISVSEGKIGLETFVSKDIEFLDRPNKRLLVAFLKGIIEEIDENDNNKDKKKDKTNP